MRYSKYRSDAGPTKKQTNPIWRGIGCIMIVITPIVAFAAANLVLASGTIQRWIRIPVQLRNRFVVPGLNLPIDNFYATLLVAAAITLVLFAGFVVVYSALYKVAGPSPYGPTDMPPIRSRRKLRKSR